MRGPLVNFKACAVAALRPLHHFVVPLPREEAQGRIEGGATSFLLILPCERSEAGEVARRDLAP